MSHVKKAFESFLVATYISEDTAFQHSYLFYGKNLESPTTVVYYKAPNEPLTYSFQITHDPHLVDLIRKGLFHQCLTPHLARPIWSLHKVLDCLASDNFFLSVSAEKF